MLALVHPDALAPISEGDAVEMPISPPIERSVYGASGSTKPKAFVITLLIHAVAIALLAIKWSTTYTAATSSAPLVVTLLPLASPPETEKEEKEKPVPEHKQETRPTTQRVEPIQRIIKPLAQAVPAPPPIDLPKVDSSPRQAETAAPKVMPAPPAPQPQNNGPDSWEGRVLARLEKFRHYPAIARSVRQQGVTYIRFRLDREGRVLSSALARSSGFSTLDQAALETVRRAEPLPKIPEVRPEEIEIVVPIEFYMK